jgi:F-type H+-transporting ATPase subunit b
MLWSTAIASDGGGGALVTPSPGLIVWTIVNFVILLLLLWLFAWKPLKNALEKRELTVRDSVEGAQQALKDAEIKRDEQAQLLKETRAEVASLIEQGRTEAEKIKDDLVQKARGEAQELVEKARRQIEAEQVQAIAKVREVAADLAVAAAERLLDSALDEARHRKVVEQYIQSLPERM